MIDDERPTLIHTGLFPMYEDVRKAVAEVLDPASLAYVVCPHFESDECGGMGRFVEEAPEAVLACSEAGALQASPHPPGQVLFVTCLAFDNAFDHTVTEKRHDYRLH